jgi:hypothetical protein
MTTPTAAEAGLAERSGSVWAKVAFVVLAGILGGGLRALDGVVRDHQAVWSWPVGLLGSALLLFVPGAYVRLFAGKDWVREVFIAMTAMYAVNISVWIVVVHTVGHSWSELAQNPGVLLAIAYTLLFSLLMGGLSVVIAWGFTMPRLKVPRSG